MLHNMFVGPYECQQIPPEIVLTTYNPPIFRLTQTVQAFVDWNLFWYRESISCLF